MPAQTLPPLMSHQEEALSAYEVLRRNEPDMPSLLVAPPGAGKSRVMLEMAARELAAGRRTMLKVHRRMLLEQMMRVMNEQGLEYGVIASGQRPDFDKPIQLVSTQTLFARAVRNESIALPEVDLLIDDEAHQQGGRMQRSLVYGSYSGTHVKEGYATKGAYVCGFTATPLMGASIYQRMIQFANYRDLRNCGMHQLVRTFGPDEIDTKGLQANQSGEFSEKGLESRVAVIFGSVWNEWRKLNPDGRPTLLYAPSVATARWFAHQFWSKGVPVGHIDGESILLPEGDRLVVCPADREHRDELLRRSRTGEIKVITNRFVLREAIDMPWIYHAIFATVMGSLTTFLQSVGRLQRFWPDYSYKVLQCHGGSYWRHGSPNDDREWRLGVTAQQANRERVDKLLKGEKQEGIRCPKCGAWRSGNQPVCFNESCRHPSNQSVRAVRTVSGRLKLMKGKVYQAVSGSDAAQKLWVSILFRCAKKDQPVSSAVAQFYQAATRKGIACDIYQLKNAPPSSSSSQWNLPVKTIYPWTARSRGRA